MNKWNEMVKFKNLRIWNLKDAIIFIGPKKMTIVSI